MDDAARKRQEHLEELAMHLPVDIEREELDQYAAYITGICGGAVCSIGPEVRERVEGFKEQFPEVWEYIEEKMSTLRAPQIEG